MALILQDFFSFPPSAGRAGGTSSDPSIRETARSGKGLKVTFAASHAGTVNGNNVMYSPAGMNDCSHTWVWPQRRPIQVHHDDHADPIGRIISARYAGYSEKDVSKEQSDALQLFHDNFKLTKDNVVEVARRLEDSQVLSQTDWRGVGELVLDGMITDSDAIEKILDGRYLGVSVTQRPQQAFCSVCGQDWVKDKECEHNRGELDEESGRVMYLIVGDTDYVEMSFVNNPADRHAMSLSTQSINNDPTILAQLDKKNKDSDILDRSMQTTVSFQLVDSLDEEIGMTIENEDKTKDSEQIPEKENAKTPIEENQKPEAIEKSETNSIEQDTDSSDNDGTSVENNPPVESNTEDSKATIEEALQCLFEDRNNLTGFMCDILFEAQEELIEEDAKLSTKKRKSLPGSSFCGPERSFPVNDCAHYTAAKRLIGRYKGPGDKSAIMACIERKGESMGCSDTKKSDKQEEIIQQDEFSIENLSDESLIGTLLAVEKTMVDRGLKAERKCDQCDELNTQLTELCDQCDELNTQLTELKDSVPKLQDTVKILREEYKVVVGEHMVSEDSHTETLRQYQDALRTIVLNSFLLTDKETAKEELEVKVNEMSFEDLKKVSQKTDLSEVISFVRSGLVRIPSETITQNDAEPIEENQIDPIAKRSESLVNFYKEYGQAFVQTVINDWTRAGKLPEKFTLDKAFELVAK
jgi:hypothetical protein